MFWRLTYISTERCRDLSTDLSAILKSSREANARNAITGVLLHSSGSFYQTLEGAKADVAATFERIKRDPRHDGFIVLQDEASERRAFAAWSMAHRDLPQEHSISGSIAQLAAGDRPAFRTEADARELDILITSFLTG